jgi:arylsulfatase A
MLHLAYNAPHTPYQAPLEDVQPYADTGRYNQNVSTLYAMVRRMDAGIGRILRTLDELDQRDNTLIVFTSDNGPVQSPQMRRFNTNLRGGKCTVWEGGIRVPLLISWPDGIQAGRSLSHMTHFADWVPTLLDAAGCDVPAGLDHDGHNLLPLLQGQAPDLPSTRFWQWTRYEVVPMHNAAVRDGDWKLLCPAAGNYLLNLDSPKGYTDAELGDYCTLVAGRSPEASGVVPPRREGWQNVQQYAEHLKEVVTRPKPDGAGLWKPQPQLFNLAEDPGETNDLAQAHPDVLQRLQGKLEDWFSRIEPQWKRHLQANPYYARDPIGARGLHTPPGQWVLHD